MMHIWDASKWCFKIKNAEPNKVTRIRNTGNKHGQLRIAIGTKIAITLKQTKCSGLFIGCGVWHEKMMNR